MAAQKQGNTLDISRPIRDVANAIARRSAAKERARQFNQRMDLQKSKLAYQKTRDSLNQDLANKKHTHKVIMDYQNLKDKKEKTQIARDRLEEAKTARKTKNKMNRWKEQNRVDQHNDKMEHAKNVLAEKTEHDKVSEGIKLNNSKRYGDYVANQINRGNAAIEGQKQNAEIKKQATGVDYNANAFTQTKPPQAQSFSDVVNTVRPNGSSLGGKPGAKDINHSKDTFSVQGMMGDK